jgi:hypothetical protein
VVFPSHYCYIMRLRGISAVHLADFILYIE